MGFGNRGYQKVPVNNSAIRYIKGSCNNSSGNTICTKNILLGSGNTTSTTTTNINVNVTINNVTNIIYNPPTSNNKFGSITFDLDYKINSIEVNSSYTSSYTFSCGNNMGLELIDLNVGTFVPVDNTITTNTDYSQKSVIISFNTIVTSGTYDISVSSLFHCDYNIYNISFKSNSNYSINIQE